MKKYRIFSLLLALWLLFGGVAGAWAEETTEPELPAESETLEA